jgi:hypothetical protein
MMMQGEVQVGHNFERSMVDRVGDIGVVGFQRKEHIKFDPTERLKRCMSVTSQCIVAQ